MFSALRLVSKQTLKFSNVNGSFTRRLLSTTSSLRLKEIREQRDGNNLTIEGVYVEHPKSKYFLKTDSSNNSCSVCATGLDIKHTDVLILSQFVRPDGCMLPRRITGLCKMQQKRIGTMVSMAQKAGLMPNLAPVDSKKDPQRRSKWKKFNTYFDESTIGKKKIKPPPRMV